MKSKSCNRRDSLKEEIINDWDTMNIATKSLIFIGIILFITSIFLTVYSDGNEGMLKSIEVIFRSSLASVFGFILSSNIKTNKIDTQNKLTRSECEEEIVEYNYKEGNTIQIFIALIICIVSIITILTIYALNIAHNLVAISQLRDLMCTSIGFLLGESSMKK